MKEASPCVRVTVFMSLVASMAPASAFPAGWCVHSSANELRRSLRHFCSHISHVKDAKSAQQLIFFFLLFPSLEFCAWMKGCDEEHWNNPTSVPPFWGQRVEHGPPRHFGSLNAHIRSAPRLSTSTLHLLHTTLSHTWASLRPLFSTNIHLGIWFHSCLDYMYIYDSLYFRFMMYGCDQLWQSSTSCF